MFLDNGLFASEIQRDVFVSDRHSYISGQLLPTDDGYQMALMLSERGPNVRGVISLLQNDYNYYVPDPAIETVEVLADQPAVLHISDVENQSIRAVVTDRDRVVRDKTYSLKRINRISDGVGFETVPLEMTV